MHIDCKHRRDPVEKFTILGVPTHHHRYLWDIGHRRQQPGFARRIIGGEKERRNRFLESLPVSFPAQRLSEWPQSLYKAGIRENHRVDKNNGRNDFTGLLAERRFRE